MACSASPFGSYSRDGVRRRLEASKLPPLSKGTKACPAPRTSSKHLPGLSNVFFWGAIMEFLINKTYQTHKGTSLEGPGRLLAARTMARARIKRHSHKHPVQSEKRWVVETPRAVGASARCQNYSSRLLVPDPWFQTPVSYHRPPRYVNIILISVYQT